MKKRIWLYLALAFTPVLLIALWILICSPFYLIDYFSSDKSNYGKIAFYHLVGWPLIGLYAIKAHIGLFYWWGLLSSYILVKLLYGKYFSEEAEIGKTSSGNEKGLLEELKREDF